MALNHGSTAVELPYLHTRLCYRTAGSWRSYLFPYPTLYRSAPWLRPFDTSGLSTTAFIAARGPEWPLTMAPQLKNCHICTHDYATAQPVPACPTALGTR